MKTSALRFLAVVLCWVVVLAPSLTPLNVRAQDVPHAELPEDVAEQQVAPPGPSKGKPATASAAEAPAGKSAKKGWSNHTGLGLWWHNYEVMRGASEIGQPGLVSLMFQRGGDYHFAPVYLGYEFSFYSPQLFWKSIGLGIFYFFCFFLTAGKCNADVSFATGDRDAGYLGLGFHGGYSFHPVPLRVYAGPDVGLFHSGLTPRPFSAVFLKGGVAFDFTDSFSLDLHLRKSVSMAQWDFGIDNDVKEAEVLLLGFQVQANF